MTTPLLLDAKSLSRLISVKPATIYAMARQGKIPCYRLTDKLVRFDWQEVQEWLRGRKAGAGA